VEGFRAQLHFREQGSSTPLGGEATSTPEGIISTRLSSAAGRMPVVGRSPFGTWQPALSDSAEVRRMFESETIVDILVVITYAGCTPAWPQ
jgi:hypothetical protein